ncbi:MAG: hypothetical protein Q8R96_04405, partial [Bacteroidota bacterium]|nr:hypothetical protein [Bacteroidota bacterium]
AKAAEGIGIAATRQEERGLAVTGQQDYAPSLFEHQESVLNAGVLFALPALISQGLERFFKVFNPLPPGFYGLHHVILILCFMALCRIKNPEQLKKHPPGELGKLLGLDRIPEVGYFRTKIKQITDQSKSDELHVELFRWYAGEMPELFFYIDGHVRVYHGDLANLPKRFVSREKLCLSGTTEFWVNDQQGLPLMVVTGELNEKLKSAIEEIIPKITSGITRPAKPGEPAFTIIVDREAYEPAWFKKLWDQHHVAIITYRKNVKDEWDRSLFYDVKTQIYNTDVTMQLCEMGTQLNGHWFREIRRLSENGHQTSVLTTHPSLSLPDTAVKMFSRWSQENFFKYMISDFDFDRMIEYGTEPVDQKRTIPNPQYKQLTYQIKKYREKKARLEARIFQQMEGNGDTTGIDHIAQTILKSANLIEKINGYTDEIKVLLAKRKDQPSRISIAEMPPQQRYNKLMIESKKLKNAIIMVVYRAESALYNTMSEFYKATDKEGRVILKEIFTSDADMIPDYKNHTLTIKLHSLSTPRANQAVIELCSFLNQTETHFPLTNLKLVYETVAL